jgi:Protein of unknown function (DUF2934)
MSEKRASSVRPPRTVRPPKSPNRSAHLTGSDIARRAYDLYLARSCEDGYDVEDWLQAERELRRSTAA